MIHHQVHKPRAVYQHNTGHRFGEADSVRRKARGSDENAALCFLPGECSIERLQFRPANRVLPALGLNVNLFQPQFIERDNAVDAGITGTADTLQIITTGAVTQAMKHIQHDHFEAVGADL